MIEYTVILVDFTEQAAFINGYYDKTRFTDHRIQAFPAYAHMVGIQHQGKRPTTIKDRIRLRSGDSFDKWYQSEVVRNADRATIVEEWRT